MLAFGVLCLIHAEGLECSLQLPDYSSNVLYLGIGPILSIAQIGRRQRSFWPNIGPRYSTSEVLNTVDKWGQNFPQGFQGC